MNNRAPRSQTSVRRRGLFRFLIWLAVFAAVMTVPIFVLPYFDFQVTPIGMIPFALPGAYALSGLIEFITGVTFLECARRWDDLKGWQRGIFGTFIVLVGGSVVILVFALIASRL
jgi:hypothetical protein